MTTTIPWATLADVQRIGLTTGDGVVLGMLNGHILRASRDLWAHTLLIGPTRKGKGVSSVVTTALSWHGDSIILDVKGEIYDIVAEALRAAGHEVYRFNPAGEIGDAIDLFRFIRWETLHQIADLQRQIESLTVTESATTEISEYWHSKAQDTLLTVGCYLHYQDQYPETIGGLRQAFVDPACPMAKLLPKIDACAHPRLTPTIATFLREGVQGLKNVPAERRQEVWDSAARYLRIWRDPRVAYHTRQMDIPFDRLQQGNRPITILLQVTAEDLQGWLRPLFRALIEQVTWRLMDRPIHVPYQRELILVLDEAGALHRIPAVETYVSQAAGYGLGSLLVFQSPNQLTRWYGERNAIIDNCGARVFYEPNDAASAEFYAKYLPDITVTDVTKRWSGERWKLLYNRDVGVTEREQTRRFPAADLLELGEDACVIRVSGGCGPILGTKLKYYSDRVFRQLATPLAG